MEAHSGKVKKIRITIKMRSPGTSDVEGGSHVPAGLVLWIQ